MDINQHLSQRIKQLRLERGYTLDELANRSHVSRAMISMIERATTNPTAVVLEKLAVALDITLVSLFNIQTNDLKTQPYTRYSEQPVWTDPESGYTRRIISPLGVESPIQLIEVDFPAFAKVTFETPIRHSVQKQQIWIISGCMTILVAGCTFHLSTGDCLAMDLEGPIIFSNPHPTSTRYILAIANPSA